ncbi:MAG TPA: hypothetical protein VEC16_04975 [Alphaproteobacteria bacterium]|nr:hypothetical protein [Alphaproteobacteria bacterium]
MDSNKLLSDVAPDKIFYLASGRPISNIKELISELSSTSIEEFSYHANAFKDDFATWIDDALGIPELAEDLRTIKDKDEYIRKLSDAINSIAQPETNQQSSQNVNAFFSDAKTEIPAPEAPSSNVQFDPVITSDAKKMANELEKEIVHKSRGKTKPEKKAKSQPSAQLFSQSNDTANINSGNAPSKEISQLKSELEKMKQANSELSKRIDTISKNNDDAKLQNFVSKGVNNYFDDKNFQKKIVEMFKSTIVEIHSRERSALKTEINNIIELNDRLDKKIDASVSNRNKQIENIVHMGVARALEASIANVDAKINKIVDSKLSKIENAFDKRTGAIALKNVGQFREEISAQKHDLRAIASEVMHREFEKLLSSDEHLAKIVTKYQKLFSEDAEHTAKIYKEAIDKFHDELNSKKDKATLESQQHLDKQLLETLKHQRALFDEELSKALSSNKYFVQRFEKEVLSREKLFLESADRKLKENYKRHDEMLGAEFDKYSNELKDMKLQSEKDFKNRETQLINSVSSKIHEQINKEFNDVIINQRNELSQSIGNARVSALNRIDKEFNDLLSQHKEFMVAQFNKAAAEQASIKEKFVTDLKSEKEKILSDVKDTMQKDLLLTVNNQREILDNELVKTVKANKDFVDRFEKQIVDIDKKINEAANKVLEEKYNKHQEMLKNAYSKQVQVLKDIVSEADHNISDRESQIFSKLNAAVVSTVRDSVNKEFDRLIVDEKKALQDELAKAQERSKAIEKKFEDLLREKEEELIQNVTAETSAKFNEIVSLQQDKLDSELSKMKKSYDAMEAKKNDILQRTTEFFDNIENYSADKLKTLEKEHDKHLKKVSKISTLIARTESALNEIKDIRAQVMEDKKRVSREGKEYSEIVSELINLKEVLTQEKEGMKSSMAKTMAYDMIHRCYDYIKKKDVKNVKATYDKVVELYNSTKFDKNDKIEIYKATQVLLRDIQNAFSSPSESRQSEQENIAR